MDVPGEIGGQGGNLLAKVKENEITWIIKKSSGDFKKYRLSR